MGLLEEDNPKQLVIKGKNKSISNEREEILSKG